MKIIYAETGKVLDPIEAKKSSMDNTLVPILLLIALMLVGIITPFIYDFEGTVSSLQKLREFAVAIFLVGGLTALITIPIVIYLDVRRHKKQQRAIEFAEKLKKLPIRIDGRRVVIDGKIPKQAVGKYVRIKTKNTDLKYMVWTFKDSVQDDCQILLEERAILPVYDFGKYYVAFLPAGKDYYLKIGKNLEIGDIMDKAKLIQDPGDKEIEFHYVAGKSRDAHVLFDCCGVEVPILRAEGIPFQKHIVHAGATDDIYALIFDNPRLGTIWQDYYKYRQMRAHIGRYYVNGKGKVKLKLDFPMAPDKVAETEAEFVLASE